MNYVQCIIRNGLRRDTSWLPERYAKMGKFLKLKNNGVWEDGWEVIATFGKATEEEVISQSMQWRHHREGTDI